MILVEPLTAAELARRLGVHRTTVGRALRLLEQFGLAAEESGRRWGGTVADAVDLAHVAAACGTIGRSKRRKERHADERAVRASKIILRARRRADAPLRTSTATEIGV